MAKQKGLIKIKGSIDELSFYESKHGFIVRKKTRSNSEQIKNGAHYARTRENLEEFGSANKAGKMLRDGLRLMIRNGSDTSMVYRLSRLLTQIKNEDLTSVRGKRNVSDALTNVNAKQMLSEFRFKDTTIFETVLLKAVNLNTTTGAMQIAGFIPKLDMNAPVQATHVSLSAGWLKIDFATGSSELQNSNVVNLPIDATASAVNLSIATAPTGTGNDVFVLAIDFFEEVNGVQYPLGGGNCVKIVEVV